MKELDVFKEIVDIGKQRGKLTYDEIYSTVPEEYMDNNELEELFDTLQDLGVEITDTSDVSDDDSPDAEEPYEKNEDLVQVYFRSMGDIAILSKDEERELARTIEEGNTIIEQLVRKLPVHREMCQNSHKKKTPTVRRGAEREKTDDALARSIEQLDRIMMIRDTEHARDAGSQEVDDLHRKYDGITKAREIVSRAKEQLIIHNLRLVVNVAKHYIGRGLTLMDLVQEGNIGLMKAIEKFDYRKGFKFSTYATWWIRQAITRALMDQTKTIRIPVHIVEMYNKITKAVKTLTQRLGREPSKEEIAQHLHVPVKKIEDIMKAVQEPVAIQTTIGNDETTLEDMIGDEAASPYDDAERNKITEQIVSVLHTLTPKEEQVVRMRFGIGVDKDHTLEEVGKHLSITRERVRQIEAKAMRKLKHPSRLRELKSIDLA